jgi:hypothetical protein
MQRPIVEIVEPEQHSLSLASSSIHDPTSARTKGASFFETVLHNPPCLANKLLAGSCSNVSLQTATRQSSFRNTTTNAKVASHFATVSAESNPVALREIESSWLKHGSNEGAGDLEHHRRKEYIQGSDVRIEEAMHMELQTSMEEDLKADGRETS